MIFDEDRQRQNSCAVLFSGGTDSTCAAALCAETFSTIHLLTFEEASTMSSPLPIGNAMRLRRSYPSAKFVHQRISTDRLVKKLSYERYFSLLFKHGFFILSTPGFSSLSWHLRTILYCRQNNITSVFDGMTRELTHFPGHMPNIRRRIANLYKRFDIDFSSPVFNWDVPPNQQLVDRLIVDRHGFTDSPAADPSGQTTGMYLYKKGIFPRPNVKGSPFDIQMQHDCYPFIVFNIFAFWNYLSHHSFESYEERMDSLFADKIAVGARWLSERLTGGTKTDALFELAESIEG